MIEIYKVLRDQDCGRFAAFKETVQMIWALRKGCIEGIHVTLDVWDDRCWHEMINDKIERLEERRVWGNPDITWSAQDWDDDLDRWMADEVEDFAPVTEVPESWGWQEDGTYVPSPGLRGFQDGIEYHPWRHG